MKQTQLPALLPRTELMKLLDCFFYKRIIYMHAPAGYGKTTSALLWRALRGKTRF